MSKLERVQTEDGLFSTFTKNVFGRPFSSLNRTQIIFLMVQFIHTTWILLLNLIIVIRISLMCNNDYDVYFYAILTSITSIFTTLVGFFSVSF